MGELFCGVGELFGHRFEDISVIRTETLTFHTSNISSLFSRSFVCAFFLEIMITCRIIISCTYLSVVNFSNWPLLFVWDFFSQKWRMSDPIAFSVFVRSDVCAFKIIIHVFIYCEPKYPYTYSFTVYRNTLTHILKLKGHNTIKPDYYLANWHNTLIFLMHYFKKIIKYNLVWF